jgi:transposase-like protein
MCQDSFRLKNIKMKVRIMAYSESFKKQVVKKALSPGIVIKDISRRLKISPNTIRKWRHLYIEELRPEIEKLWEDYKKEEPEPEKIDIDTLLLEAARKEYSEYEEDKLPNIGEVLLNRKRINKYTVQEKYVIVKKVRMLNKDEEGKFLRRNGFKKQQIKIWEDELLAMSRRNIKDEEYIRQLEEENRKLKKELKESDKEKNELKILIELKKKYPSLFRDGEES